MFMASVIFAEKNQTSKCPPFSLIFSSRLEQVGLTVKLIQLKLKHFMKNKRSKNANTRENGNQASEIKKGISADFPLNANTNTDTNTASKKGSG